MITEVKRFIIGNPIASSQASHERLTKVKALAVFSSDALSSVAYATEAIKFQLINAGVAALAISMPLALAIALLLITVSYSYRQTIHAYPQGGGAYIVTKDNLNVNLSLIAGASLLIDYVLTVAVSVAAGVAALTSLSTAVGISWLSDYRVLMCLVAITLVTVTNLRGVRESGSIFAVPTYVFVGSILTLIVLGIFKVLTDGAAAPTEDMSVYAHVGSESLGAFLLLRAFSAGCTALTGIEAISDGVPAFKAPESRNAATTLTWMAALLCTMFLGITFLANQFGAVPIPEHEPHYETVVSQITRTIVGVNWFYWLVQISTALILILAANTAFADFPRLASWLARDRFMPRQFNFRGDRLAFSNGIVVLGVLAGLIDIKFDGNVNALLPLYAVGVFTGFTLSQSAMVVHWLRLKGANWQRSVAINGAGALVTAVVLVVIVFTKFLDGAWMVVGLIPIVVLLMKAVNRHYRNLANELRLSEECPIDMKHIDHVVVVPIADINRATLPALRYARSISNDVRAIHVTDDPESAAKLRAKWERAGCGDIPLVILENPYRSLVGPLLQYIDALDNIRHDDMLTVVMAEFVPKHWWEYLLHGQTSLGLKAALMFRKNKVVTTVRYHLKS